MVEALTEEKVSEVKGQIFVPSMDALLLLLHNPFSHVEQPPDIWPKRSTMNSVTDSLEAHTQELSC